MHSIAQTIEGYMRQGTQYLTVALLTSVQDTGNSICGGT